MEVRTQLLDDNLIDKWLEIDLQFKGLCCGSMNFKEFNELINSGAKEIALTEDVFLVHGEGEKYYPSGIEIIFRKSRRYNN